MAKTIDEIISECEVIKNETEQGANTAERVGGAMQDIGEFAKADNETLTSLDTYARNIVESKEITTKGYFPSENVGYYINNNTSGYIDDAVIVSNDSFMYVKLQAKAGEVYHYDTYKGSTPVYITYDDDKKILLSGPSGANIEAIGDLTITQDCNLIINYRKKSTSIGFLYDYYTKTVTEEPKIKDVGFQYFQKKNQSTDKDVDNGKVKRDINFCLLHFSDLHSSANALSNLELLRDKYSGILTDTICTGDLKLTYDDDYSYYLADDTAKTFLLTMGNHECALTASATKSEFDTHKGKDCFDKFISPIIYNWGATVSTCSVSGGALVKDTEDADVYYVSDKCYWFKDYEQGVRIIGLDICDWDTDQSAWLSAVLADSYDKQVIICSHYQSNAITRTYSKFDNATKYTSNGWFTIGAEDLVNTFIENGGTFICWLTGHTHFDQFGHLRNYPNQLNITIACASNTAGFNGIGSLIRSCKNDADDCFVANLMNIDLDNKILYIQRFGANRTIYGDTLNSIAYDYKNNVIIRES